MEAAQAQYIVSQLKKEIFSSSCMSNAQNSFEQLNKKRCVNALTRKHYTFDKGSKDEKDLYRVMPDQGPEKLFFDSESEYFLWKQMCKGFKIKELNIRSVAGLIN